MNPKETRSDSVFLKQSMISHPWAPGSNTSIIAEARFSRRGWIVLGIIGLFFPFPPFTSIIGILLIIGVLLLHHFARYVITAESLLKIVKLPGKGTRVSTLNLSDIREIEVLKGSMKPDGSFLDSMIDFLGGSGNIYVRFGDHAEPETLSLGNVRHPEKFAETLRSALPANL